MNAYEAAWAAYLPALAEATARSEEAFAFLHVAKTGGTSLSRALRADPRWAAVSLPFSFLPEASCDCLARPCPIHGLNASMDGFGSAGFAPEQVAVKVPHERYAAIVWLRESLVARGGRIDACYLTCRPVRDRLVSVFTDYWTRVDQASRVERGDLVVGPDEVRNLQGYADDSRHYRQDSGSINGTAWFEAFAEHGSGFPFFLDQVFDGSRDRLVHEVRAGRLSLLPATELDGFITRVTGRADVQRHRESSVAHLRSVLEALDAARPMIDRLAERDRPFDRAIAELTGHDEFAR